MYKKLFFCLVALTVVFAIQCKDDDTSVSELEGLWIQENCTSNNSNYEKNEIAFDGKECTVSFIIFNDTTCIEENSNESYDVAGTFTIGNSIIDNSGIDAKQLLLESPERPNDPLKLIYTINGNELFLGTSDPRGSDGYPLALYQTNPYTKQ